jgi:hypothetical protein
LSTSHQSNLSKFLQSNKIHTIGTYTLGKTIGEGKRIKKKLRKKDQVFLTQNYRIFWKSEDGRAQPDGPKSKKKSVNN